MTRISVETGLGRLAVEAEGGRLTSVRWSTAGPLEGADGALLDEAAAQLRAYAEGRLRAFDLPLAPAASPLAAEVRAAMLAVPFGETTTYGTIAAKAGAPAQAVGQECGANPLPVIVPCHRVVAANGLGGFSSPGGVETKVKLLRHEGAYSLLI